MFKSLNKNTMILFVVVAIISLSFFVPVIALGETPEIEKSKYAWVLDLLKLLIAAFFGFLFSLYMIRRRDKQQSRSLIIAFLAEFIYNFRRCVLYHEQVHVADLATKSSLYELTDAGALSNLANVVDNPEVISTIVELKSHYYQIKRHTDIIASQIAERDRITSRIALLKKVIVRAGGPAKKAFAEEEVERLSSEEGSLGKAIGDAQGTAVVFFEYKKVANYIEVILNEAKKLMPERQVIAQYEKEFRNNWSAIDFIDEKKNERFKLDPEKLDQWRENIEKEFNRIRNEGL